LVRVVYNGIDASAFEPVADRAALRRQLGLDPNALTLGLFGRITPWKGQHVLLDALKELPGAHALIVGGPLFGETDYVNELERLARYPALAGRVRFLGFRGDIPALMQAVDIVAHTSTSPEPFGRVIVEAMLARRPVVATATGGVLEIVDDGLDGVLVPPADPRALAKAIARLADDSGMRESLVEAGYRKASSQFSHAGMVAAVDAVMREVCSSMAGPREASIAEILPIELAQSRQRSDVLFVSQSAEPSGAELSLCDMATGLGRDALVCLFEQGPLVEILRSRGVQVNVLADARLRKVHGSARMSSVLLAIPSVLRLAADVRRLSRRRGAALLYANSQKAWIVSALVAWWDRKPVVWHLRDMLSSPRFAHLQRSIAVFLANRVASRVIVNSGATGDAFAAVGGRRDLLRLVHNGIDPRPFEAVRGASSSPLRRELDLGDSVVVGMFGRLAPWKGQHVFLEALERLPGVHGLIVGDALFGEHEYRDELRSLAARPSLRGRVRFLGHRADVAELMRAVDIVVHASIEPEPFGRVIVEGMLAERPVIATVGGGVAEIVTHGVDGLLVEAGDSAALAASIKSLSEDEARAKKIAAAGRQTAQEHFLVEAMCNGVAGVVDELLQIGSCPRR
jgi:glycosyltransferase involved in cell wall biosynthesis